MSAAEGSARSNITLYIALLGASLLIAATIVSWHFFVPQHVTIRSNPDQTRYSADRYRNGKKARVPIETGKASWYDLEGKTASGELMDDQAFTAAHPSLPLGTELHIENLGNGRSVDVRVNDRGPFVKDRIVDLSRAAAEHLDMMGDGVATVQLKKSDHTPAR